MNPNRTRIINLGYEIRTRLEEIEVHDRCASEMRLEVAALETELDGLIGAPGTAEPADAPESFVETSAEDVRAELDKHRVFSDLIEDGVVRVFVNPSLREDLMIPPALAAHPFFYLDIGFEMAIPIPDLAWDDDGVRATLSFSGAPHTCYLPWTSIFAITDAEGSEGAIWKREAPPGSVVVHRAPAPAPAPAPTPSLNWKQPSLKGLSQEPREERRLKLVEGPRCWTCNDDPRGELIDCDGSAGYRRCLRCAEPEGCA